MCILYIYVYIYIYIYIYVYVYIYGIQNQKDFLSSTFRHLSFYVNKALQLIVCRKTKHYIYN